MTNGQQVLWLLRIYGPCSVAELLRHTPMDRPQLVSALYRQRQKGTAERSMRATYRLTDAGRNAIKTQPRPATKDPLLF